jgi:hypothetical protein
MQHYKRLIIFCCVSFFSAQLFAQNEPDITGLWKGTMYNDSTQKFLKYEIAISENKGKLSGYSHTYFILDDKEYHGVKKVKIKREDGKIIVQDVELIANNYPIPPAKGVRQLDILTLEIKDGVMTLSGPFSTNRTKFYRSLTGNINVQRKTNFRQSALVPHLEELGKAEELSFVQEEKVKATTASAKIVSEPPIVKTAPVVKEKPVITNETQPAVKKEEVNTVAKTQQVNKPAETKSSPIVKEKPVNQTTVRAQEKAIVKNNPVTEQKPVTVKADTIAKPIQETAIKITKAEPEKAAPVVKAAVDIVNRTIETIQSVNYVSDSLVLTLYDNGEVDGDTVSVLMNGELIMPRVGLSTNAVRKTIYAKDIPDSIQIVMYAETLGSLPPNTGLLIVYDGTERYEIRFSGDLKKNAAIVFKKKKSPL